LNYKDGKVRRILCVHKKTSLKGELFMKKGGAKSGTKGGIKGGLGQLLWKISVALYLIANGVLGLNKRGDFKTIFDFVFKGTFSDMVVMIVSIIALLAGILVLFAMLKVKFSFLDELLVVVAIIWLVYVIVEILYWLRGGIGNNLWDIIQKLAVHLMVLGSLLLASRKFGG
jgi:hypothetical protein